MRGSRWSSVVLVFVLSSCASTAPNYTASPRTTQSLQALKIQPVRVGAFTAAPTASDTGITLRSVVMQAPQGSFSRYLADAVRNELELVRLHAPGASTEVSGVLIRNELNTGLAVTGEGLIEARFVVRRDGQIRFDKVMVARIEWDSSFVGAIAIPRAQQEYARLVGKLVTETFTDADFVAALK